ncbi:unnamed protein product [Brassica oleracea]
MHGHWNQAIQNLTLNKRIKQRLKRNGKERGSGQSGSDGPKTCILSQSCKHI